MEVLEKRRAKKPDIADLRAIGGGWRKQVGGQTAGAVVCGMGLLPACCKPRYRFILQIIFSPEFHAYRRSHDGWNDPGSDFRIARIGRPSEPIASGIKTVLERLPELPHF